MLTFFDGSGSQLGDFDDFAGQPCARGSIVVSGGQTIFVRVLDNRAFGLATYFLDLSAWPQSSGTDAGVPDAHVAPDTGFDAGLPADVGP